MSERLLRNYEDALTAIETLIHERDTARAELAAIARIGRERYELGLVDQATFEAGCRANIDIYNMVREENERLRKIIEDAPCPQRYDDPAAICYCEDGIKINCWKLEVEGE